MPKSSFPEPPLLPPQLVRELRASPAELSAFARRLCVSERLARRMVAGRVRLTRREQQWIRLFVLDRSAGQQGKADWERPGSQL
jgi:hypothetical protein